MSAITPPQAGKFANPDVTVVDDPRLDPRIKTVLAMVDSFAPGLDPPALNADYETCLEYANEFEQVAALTHPELLANMPKFASVTSLTEVIQGIDGNDINLFIHRPANMDGPLPCIVHIHGGGMVIMTAEDPNYILWRNSLADAGVVVVGVEYRNGAGRMGPHPFPAGLNDCVSAVKWVDQNRADLNISNIVISGESGGGNLSLATTLQAKQDGWLDVISGVYAMCPYISGVYANPPAELPSLFENDGYMLDMNMMSALVTVYDPSGENLENPLAWPYCATTEELAGLPPHVISVNELDPLRDEGLAYYRKLLTAGVPTIGRTAHGTPHGGDAGFPEQTPEVYADVIRAITGFAGSL